MTPKSALGALAGSSLLAVALIGSAVFSAPSAAATPPPTPPPLNAPATPAPDVQSPAGGDATPIPLPSGFGGLPGSTAPAPGAGASPSPPPDARKGLEGVWEVQIQRGNKTDYAHFKLAQTGTTLTGTFLNNGGKPFPMAGSVDGQAVRLVISMPDGTTLLIEGRLDGTTDMIGILTMPNEQVPFSAAYRPKEKWIDNLNAAPGGLGGGGGGGGGGGYTPPR